MLKSETLDFIRACAREFDVRAVWLFSRNDAIGNIAVLVAAGLVAWTKTAWPDLAVAVIISGLFLHSAWAILRDARADLQRLGASNLHT